MKASELRDLLQDAIDKYGDLQTTVNDEYGNYTVSPEFVVCDKNGYESNHKLFSKPYEIWLAPT